MTPLAERALDIALSYEGVTEVGGNNRGPQVEAWLSRLGMPAGMAWCASFVWCCVDDACEEMGRKNPLFKSAGVLKMWGNTSRSLRSYKAEPGAIFIIDHGKGLGHTGFVTGVDWVLHKIRTIEGNTNQAGSRDGGGVYRRQRDFNEIAGFLVLD